MGSGHIELDGVAVVGGSQFPIAFWLSVFFSAAKDVKLCGGQRDWETYLSHLVAKPKGNPLISGARISRQNLTNKRYSYIYIYKYKTLHFFPPLLAPRFAIGK